MKEFIKVGFLCDLYLIYCFIVFLSLKFYPFFGNKPFLLELLQTHWDLPIGLIFICSLLNLVLIYLLTKKLFSPEIAFYSALIYATSSWAVYLGLFNSSYILGVFFLLILGLGTLNTKKILSLILTALGCIGLLSLSILFWLPLLGLLVIFRKKSPQGPVAVAICLIWLVFLIALGFHDLENFKHQFYQEVTIFEDVGLINTVDRLQGEARGVQLGFLGRIVYNKYTYLGLKIVYNLSNHFVPFTYFTPKFKLLSFSQEPPFLLGFLIPAIWGVRYLIQGKQVLNILYLFGLLILPSVLASNSPDLNRLFMVAPIIFIFIAVGIKQVKTKNPQIFWVMVVLLILQELVIISDIYLREPIRLLPMIQHVYGKIY